MGSLNHQEEQACLSREAPSPVKQGDLVHLKTTLEVKTREDTSQYIFISRAFITNTEVTLHPVSVWVVDIPANCANGLLKYCNYLLHFQVSWDIC